MMKRWKMLLMMSLISRCLNTIGLFLSSVLPKSFQSPCLCWGLMLEAGSWFRAAGWLRLLEAEICWLKKPKLKGGCLEDNGLGNYGTFYLFYWICLEELLSEYWLLYLETIKLWYTSRIVQETMSWGSHNKMFQILKLISLWCSKTSLGKSYKYGKLGNFPKAAFPPT